MMYVADKPAEYLSSFVTELGHCDDPAGWHRLADAKDADRYARSFSSGEVHPGTVSVVTVDGKLWAVLVGTGANDTDLTLVCGPTGHVVNKQPQGSGIEFIPDTK